MTASCGRGPQAKRRRWLHGTGRNMSLDKAAAFLELQVQCSQGNRPWCRGKAEGQSQGKKSKEKKGEGQGPKFLGRQNYSK